MSVPHPPLAFPASASHHPRAVYLTAAHLPHYLLSRGLIEAEAIVEGEFTVREQLRRNRNFRVSCGARQGLFLKQAGGHDPGTAETLAREADCHRLAASRPLARWMPRFLDYDPARFVLALELLEGAENANRYHARAGGLPEAVAGLLAEALARCHSVSRRALSAAGVAFPEKPPWILSCCEEGAPTPPAAGAAHRRLLEILRGDSACFEPLRELRRRWRRRRLIHGDLKWDNCLVREREPGRPRLWLVDWEMADVGDPAWDVAAVLHSYLLYALFAAEVDPGEIAGLLAPPLGRFWASYARRRRSGNTRNRLATCTRMAGARALQTAFEGSMSDPEPRPEARRLLDVARELLGGSAAASRRWFGLEAG